LQTKLKINEPGDIYEREADRIADQVMAVPTHQAVNSAPPHIQRFSGHPTGQMDAVPASVDQALASPGRPLEPALQQDMGRRFGYDFSRVRVHTGQAAEQSARDVNANAYTVGNHIVFAAGRFAPGMLEGRRLIAHELAHTLQQAGPNLMRASAIVSVDSAEERQADALEVGRTAGTFSAVHDAGTTTLHRQATKLNECWELTSQPLPARKWRYCVAQGKIDPNHSYPLRFTQTGEIVTTESLVAWAAREGLNQNTVMTRFDSHVFSGSGQAWVEGREKAAAAFAVKPLETRKTERREEQQAQADAAALKAAEEEDKKRLEAAELIVKDYYTRGEKLKPKGASLVPIEEAAEAEKRGRSAGTVVKDTSMVEAYPAVKMDRVTYFRGQRSGRFTVVSPNDFIVKVNDRYYYQVDGNTMYDLIYGYTSYTEQVWENTKGINVAYGYLLKGVGFVLSLLPHPAAQFSGPFMRTAGEGLHYDVRRIDAMKAGDDFNERAPEIGPRTVVEGIANVAGGKFGMGAGRWVGKYFPKVGVIVGGGTGMYTSSIIVRSYEAVQGNMTWRDVLLPPDASPIEFLVAMVGARYLNKFSERWNKGKAPVVPKDVTPPPPALLAPVLPVKAGGEKQAGTPDKPAISSKVFQPVTKGVSPTLDKVRARFRTSEHHLEVTPEGLKLCTSCELIRKIYKRELAQKENKSLARLLDELEKQRIANPNDKTLQQRSLILEERLGEIKARNDLLGAITDERVRNKARSVVEPGIGLDREQVAAFAQAMKTKKSTSAQEKLVHQMDVLAKRTIDERNRQQMQGRVDRKTDSEVERAFDEGRVVAEPARKRSATTETAPSKIAHETAPNIDEILAVGAPKISDAESRRRALDLDNREFKDAPTNQAHKHVMTDPRDVKRVEERDRRVSLKGRAASLFGLRFGRIVEVNKIGERIKSQMKGKDTRDGVDLKNELNAKLIAEFKNPTTAEGRIVAEAMERSGFGIVETTKGQQTVRALTDAEMTARGYRFVEGEGWGKSKARGKTSK
jgi:hypothetical protein